MSAITLKALILVKQLQQQTLQIVDIRQHVLLVLARLRGWTSTVVFTAGTQLTLPYQQETTQ